MKAALVVAFLWGAAAAVLAEDPPAPRIVNVVNDFLAYHAACRDATPETRAARWNTMLEAKHPPFFRDAIYRRLEGQDLANYKATCVGAFWAEVAPRMGEIAKLNEGVEERIRTVLADFRKVFPDFETATDFYVTISFSFRGKVVTVGERDVLGIGLEKLEGEGDLSLRITLAHELFHLHHLPRFSAGGGLYRLLWTEGLATYAAARVVPGQRMSTCLGFSAEKMNRCQELLPKMAKQLRENLGENDHRLKRAYFGAEDNDLGVPPEAGYYVGLLVVQSLAAKQDVKDLARLGPEQVLPLLADALARLAPGG